MKSYNEKYPIIFEIIILVIGLLVSSVLAGIFNAFGCDNEVSGAVARIIVGFIFIIVFQKNIKFNKSLKGFVPMLPLLLLAIYKIPYHFVSGGENVDAITISILLIGLAPAVFEEIIFRGIFISNLKKKYNNPMSIVLISSVVFSLIHITNIGGLSIVSLILQLIMAFVVGIAFGAIYLYTEDIVSVIIAHFFIDVFSGIFPGGDTTPFYFLVILALIFIIEIMYGLLFVKKINKEPKSK